MLCYTSSLCLSRLGHHTLLVTACIHVFCSKKAYTWIRNLTTGAVMTFTSSARTRRLEMLRSAYRHAWLISVHCISTIPQSVLRLRHLHTPPDAHCLFIGRTLTVHWLYINRSLVVHCPFIGCTLTVHWPYIDRSNCRTLTVHWLYITCTLTIHHLSIFYSLPVH